LVWGFISSRPQDDLCLCCPWVSLSCLPASWFLPIAAYSLQCHCGSVCERFGFLSSLSDVDFSVGIAHLEIFLNFFLLFIMTEHKFIVEFSCFPQFSFAGVTVRVPQTTTYVVNNGLTLGSAGPQLTVHHRPPQVHNVSISACLLDLLSH
jgi:hypothetical protein